MAMPTVGQKAPEFTLPISREQNISLKDYPGQQECSVSVLPA
jgi:peroxiredoxin